jgi:SAM-dependent methyltransferase
MQRVNYDTIAHLYDAPDRQHDVDQNLPAYLVERPDLGASSIDVLDIGCGTGKQVASNRRAYPRARIVGSDLFLGMLRVASRNEPEALWAQSDASCVGFRDNTFDYVTNQFSYAHIQNKPNFTAEILRVLKPGGRLVVTNIDPWSMDNWIMYRFFPSARDLDHSDFLKADDFVELTTRTGFDTADVRLDHRQKQERLGGFLTYASERHHASHFLAMTDRDYETGLASLKSAVIDLGEDTLIESESCLLTLSADKPKD